MQTQVAATIQKAEEKRRGQESVWLPLGGHLLWPRGGFHGVGGVLLNLCGGREAVHF